MWLISMYFVSDIIAAIEEKFSKTNSTRKAARITSEYNFHKRDAARRGDLNPIYSRFPYTKWKKKKRQQNIRKSFLFCSTLVHWRQSSAKTETRSSTRMNVFQEKSKRKKLITNWKISHTYFFEGKRIYLTWRRCFKQYKWPNEKKRFVTRSNE